MCFTDDKKKEIMSQHGIAKVSTRYFVIHIAVSKSNSFIILFHHFPTKDNDDLLKIVAGEWSALTDKDRAYWDEEARNDKVRYDRRANNGLVEITHSRD
jgi:hypothetical protein